MADTEVLIVGAGPTGLVLALWLTKLGVRVRIVDKTAGPGTTSRALVLHARNLEFYRQIGIVDAALQGGSVFHAANLWVNGQHAARLPFDDLGSGLSAYPFALVYPQDEHERMLIDQLERVGIHVERQTELVAFREVAGGVQAELKNAAGEVASCQARYLAGCDGARSTVREALGIGFPGGTYFDRYYVADIAGEGPTVNGEVNVALDDADFLAFFPMKQPGHVRLVGALRQNPQESHDLTWEDVDKRVMEQLQIRVREVFWFSTYHVHHRVASAFRRGPVFLLGDAAHVHSPVGGQGMNTGIGDAVNLSWKLAAVLRDRLDPALLDTFETERIAFARKLVETTDRAFAFVSARGPIATWVRLNVAPFVMPKLFERQSVRRLLFRTVSQIAIKYRHSRLSEGGTGKLRAGDRLPWVVLDPKSNPPRDNYASLASLDWQVHCYGTATPELKAACEQRGLALHEFLWQESMEQSRIKRNAIYLVRPDGYIGLIDDTGEASALIRYLGDRRILTAKQ